MKTKLIIFALLSLAAAAAAVTFFMQFNAIANAASVEGDEINQLFRILLAISGVVFAVVVTGIILAVAFFRRRRGERGGGLSFHDIPPLEVAWTVIPLLIVIGISVYSGLMLNRMTEAAPGQPEVNVQVTAYRYNFAFEYPELGVRSMSLMLPVDQRVHLTFISLDVIHSFWVPEFGTSQDILPGSTTELRITPNETGSYTILCSQLCGPGHTDMTAPCTVMTGLDFESWVAAQPRVPVSTITAPASEGHQH